MSERLTDAEASFMGMKVIVHNLPPVPRIQISPTFKWCTDEFRARENAEWLKMFGTKNFCYLSSGGILMNKESFTDLKRVVMLKDFV